MNDIIEQNFSQFQPLVKELLRKMNLNADQVHQLNHYTDREMSNVHLERVGAFFKDATKLLVCGDYDCDGISATTIAVMLAKKLDIPCGHYIPNRITEGYGVSQATLKMAHEKGYRDILLVDNGVKSQAPIAYAQALGLRVGVVDHHLIENEVVADCFLHPDLCAPYFASMCASGLMYCVANYMELADDSMLILAAVATIADVMPLWGKNREIVRKGLQALNERPFQHIDLLAKRTAATVYTSSFVAFNVVPKINAVGRMSDAVNVNTFVNYFMAKNQESLKSYAQQVLSINEVRKRKGKHFKELALRKVTSDNIQIIADPDFHEGLLGIVANQVARATQKPSIILTQYETVYKGSARSVNISLSSIFDRLDPAYFLSMGGHHHAYGLSVRSDRFLDFKRDVIALSETFDLEKEPLDFVVAHPEMINETVIEQLRLLEPYGQGFRLPYVAVSVPGSYELKRMNGYGFKWVFRNYPLKEAVFFTSQYSENEVRSATHIVGAFDLNQKDKCILMVEDVY